VYNVDAAVTCALPYHATPQFVRLLQVLQLEGTRWTVLSGVKVQGAAPSRDALVRSVARDSSLLALVSDAATAAAASGGARSSRGVASAFFTLLLAESVASMSRVPEGLLPRLLPYVHAGLDKSAAVDHHAGALIIITQLASRVQLAQPLVEALLVGVAKAARAPLEPHSLQAALQLARTQAVDTLPHHAVTYLVKLPALPELLAQLGRSCSTDALLWPLLRALAERLGTHQTHLDVLLALVRDGAVHSCAELLAARLFVAAGYTGASPADAPTQQAAAALATASRSAVVDVLRALHRRCPAEVARAATGALKTLATQAAREPFAAFLRDTLAGTTAQPLRGHDSVTLGDGLDHAMARVREAALRELAQLADGAAAVRSHGAAAPADVLQQGMLRDVLLRRVCDPDVQVSAAALSVTHLSDLVADDPALFHASATCLLRSVAALRTLGAKAHGGKSGGHRAVAKRALKLAASTLPHRTPSLRDAAARLLLELVISGGELQSLSHAARGFAASLQHPLFGSLSGVAAGDDDLATPHAERRALITLGNAMSTASGELVSWARSAWPDMSAHGQHTLLLALLRALSSAPDTETAGTIAGAAWELLLLEPATLRAQGAFSDGSFEWVDGLPPQQYLDVSAVHDPSFKAVLHRRLLLAAIQALPAAADDDTRADVGTLGVVFAALCGTPPTAVLQPHMDAVLARCSAHFSSRGHFLCLLVSAAPNAVHEPAQATAVALLHDCISVAALPHLIVALASPRRTVRKAVVDVVSASAGGQPKRGAKVAEKRGTREGKEDALVFIEALAAEHGDALISGDGAQMTQLLRVALRGAGCPPLLQVLLDFLGSSAPPQSYAACQIVRMLFDSGSEHAASAALTPLWETLCVLPPGTFQEQQLQLAEGMCRLFAASATAPDGRAAPAKAALMRAVGETGAAALRAVVLSCITADVYAELSAADQDGMLAQCALLLSRDEEQACRDAARALICRLPLEGDAFARVLHSACSAVCGRTAEQASVKKRAPRNQQLPPACCDAQPLEVLTASLEVATWKTMPNGAPLLASVGEVVSVLLDIYTASRDKQEADPGFAANAGVDADVSGQPALEYRIQLALNVLTSLVQASAPGCAVQVPVTVRALREVADAGVHKAALELLAAAACAAPERVVSDVLDVTLALTTKAASGVEDRASARALQDAFEAVAACWVTSRNDGGAELLHHVVAALPAVPEHQRLPLLAALLRSLPSPLALSLTLQLLVTPSGSTTPETLVAEALRTLAATVCSVRPALECFQALCGFLQRTASGDAALISVAADFVTQQLRSPGHTAWVAGQGSANKQLHACFSELIALAIGLLKRASEAQELSVGEGQSMRHSVQAVLTAMENLMAPLRFLEAVTQLFTNDDQHVQRRALRIFLSRIRASNASSTSVSAEHAALISPLVALVRRTDRASIATRCTALAVLAALIERFGQSQEFAAALLPVMPDVLSAAAHAKPLVAARSLECVAAAVTALSTRMVPLLPAVLPVVLGIFESEADDVSRVSAALAALTSMIVRMDSFLSPYAQRLVQLLLAPRFVTSPSAEVAQAAAAARVVLAQRVPARILIEPLSMAWKPALDDGAASAVALLQQVTALVEAMDTAAAAAHHESVFAFLLRCLDARRMHTAPVALDTHALESIEGATVTAAVALVLKLSEAQFTPLFMTALEWSRARPESCARPFAFFRLVSALAAALRSVFVPFFRHLLADAVTYLEQRPADEARPSKKSRGASDAVGASRLAGRLRTEVVRSLSCCFLHDSVGFLDEARFNKLMAPLVLQLELEVPAEMSADEAADADATLVGCIVHMAQNVRQDTLWRPLNRGVLMSTRSEQMRPRRLGLAILTQLVEHLAEEYLVLLPETLPFLAELMEDADEQTEAAARQLVANLSQLADEDVAELLRA
jgi:hypothetical protein